MIRSNFNICQCRYKLHPRNWIPAPCLTTKEQMPVSNRYDLKRHRISRSTSTPSLSSSSDMLLYERQIKPSKEDLFNQLQNLEKEKQVIQKSIGKHEKVPYPLKQVLYKRKTKEPCKDISAIKKLELNEDKKKKQILPSLHDAQLLEQLEESYRKLSNKDKRAVYKKLENGFISKKKRSSHRRKEKGMEGVSSLEYKYLALRRKYQDLHHYMQKVEAEKEILLKENKALHSAHKEEISSQSLDQTKILDNKITKMSGYIKKLEEELKEYCGVKEENLLLRIQIDRMKSESEKLQQYQEQETENMALEKELVLMKKLNETKILYDKAINGYKKQLELKDRELDALKKANYNYEIGARELSDNKIDQTETTKHLIKLEQIIYEKDKDIELLNQELKKSKSTQDSLTVTTFENNFLPKLQLFLTQYETEILNEEKTSFIESVKDTLTNCFENLKENEEKIIEFRNVKNELNETKIQLENLKSKYEKLEALTNDDGKERVEKQLLVSFESKLGFTEEALQNEVMNNKLLTERLKRSLSDAEGKGERIEILEQRVSKLTERNRDLQNEIDNLESKILNLQKSIERKDEILECNSTQLDERIRSCANLNSQIEKLKESHNQEILSLKLKSTSQDSELVSKLKEVQTQNDKLESRLNIIKQEKHSQEKMLRKQLKMMEDQVDHLTFRNNTFQRQLETIQDTYRSLFSANDHINLFDFVTKESKISKNDT